MPVGTIASRAGGLLAVAGLAAFAWGSLVERRRFSIRHEIVPVLRPGATSIRVLHLSDVHLAPWQTDKQEWIRSLVQLEPDLVVSTGDVLGHTESIDAVEETLAPFAGIPGVFVNGSNDYFGPKPKNPLGYFFPRRDHAPAAAMLDTDRLERFFTEDLGWFDLNNAGHNLTINGSNIEFFGVNDAHRNWDDLGALPSIVEELRENSSWKDGGSDEVLSIGVTHAPYQRVLNAFVNYGAELILAGHTHGGQVRIPGLPALVTNCDIPRNQANGLSIWYHARGAAFLNVSAGIGTSIYAPVRFACPPEAVLLTLVADDFSYS